MFTTQKKVSSKIETEVAKMDFETVRNAVMRYMARDGEDRWSITDKQWRTLYMTFDGFGIINEQFAAEQCFDWSHVRDSSEQAFRRAWVILNVWHIEGMLKKAK